MAKPTAPDNPLAGTWGADTDEADDAAKVDEERKNRAAQKCKDAASSREANRLNPNLQLLLGWVVRGTLAAMRMCPKFSPLPCCTYLHCVCVCVCEPYTTHATT